MPFLATWAFVVLAAAAPPLSGRVVDTKGKPVANADVWLTADDNMESGAEVRGHVVSDADGRFSIDLPATNPLRWRWALWAYAPGRTVGARGLGSYPESVKGPHNLTLGPPGGMKVRVLDSEGKPVGQARVQPSAHFWPAPLRAKVAAVTDDEGRAVLPGVAPGVRVPLEIATQGELAQTLTISGGAEERTIRLRPLGRIIVKLIGNDPKALAGWTITASTRPDPARLMTWSTCTAQGRTDATGRVTLGPLAEGQVVFRVAPPRDVPYLATPPRPVPLRGGETLELSVPVERAIKVVGSVREHGTGKPAAGITVSVSRAGIGGVTEEVITDAAGQFSLYRRPETIRVSTTWFQLPDHYYQAPDDTHWFDEKLTAGEESHTLKPLEVRPAAKLEGKVVDEEGKPVTMVDVRGSGYTREFAERPIPGAASTNVRGEFVLGRMPFDSTVEIKVSIRHRAESQPVKVRVDARGDIDAPIVLRLVNKPGVSLRGRVQGPDGQAVSGAQVRIFYRVGREENVYGNFHGEETTSGPDGRFQTAATVPVADQYRVLASAAGMESAFSVWFKASDAKPPDVILHRAVEVRKLNGRVVDADDKAVAGAEVSLLGDDPTRSRLRTDRDGRFTIEDVPGAPTFLFVKKPGFRFTGRRVGPGDSPVEIAVARIDGPAPLALKRLPPPLTYAEERARARSLAAPLWKTITADEVERPGRIATVPTLALVDPERMIVRIEDQVFPAGASVVGSIALGLYGEDPRSALAALAEIRPAHTACEALIAFFDAVPDMPAGLRRKLLDRALSSAREADSREQRASLLAKVADRWFVAASVGKARSVLDEARGVYGEALASAPIVVRRAVAEPLARVDLAAALALLGHSKNDEVLAALARRCAASDPAGAARIYQGLSGRNAKLNVVADLLAEMATTDLPRALDLAKQWGAPAVGALAAAAAARSLAARDPAQAKALLADCFDRLEGLSGRMVVPAVAMARLLPLAVEIAPERSSEYLWRAVAACPLRSSGTDLPSMTLPAGEYYVIQAQVAALVACYDRAVAEVVFAPVAAQAPKVLDVRFAPNDLATAILRATVLFDPNAAEAMLESLPQETGPAQERGPAMRRFMDPSARSTALLTLARTLALPPAARIREVLKRPRQPDLWPALLVDGPTPETRKP